ncbi:MAG: transporter substrate-binding domain-containing protein [Gemmiger sp.]|uniref:transporter substrate-binding domain-containing protein n=1 Tax=Gemmiger sp. TaxID=2049027 RepID=UPI002A822C51|nr:transporter substrate-binding domain-containing protein [Gemmiger sp.]MDY4879127.1 transporter substrate-binding domain-containing protein [Gemmiger sp.]
MKKVLSVFLAAGLALSLAACGGSSSSASSASTADSVASASEAASSSEAASTSDKVWVIATDTVFKPFEYTDASGSFVGIDVDLLAAIAEDQGFQYELKSLGWDAAIAACQAGQADGMIAGASITEERKSSGWTFSDGYYTATQSMTVAADSDIAGFEDLSGKDVAVKIGTQGAAYAESLKDEYGFNIVSFEDSPTMYQAVLGGQCAACFEDTPIMQASIKDGGLALKVLENTANEGGDYGFAIFNTDNQELLDLFNAGLADIKANGTYDEILAKYLG